MNNFHLGLLGAAAALSYGAPLLAAPDCGTQEVVKEVVTRDGGDGKQAQHVEFRKIVTTADGKALHGRHTDQAELARCTGRKFESSAEVGTDKKKVSKMVLCAGEGTSDQEWSTTLKDALANLQADDRMPAEGKAKILADLNAEIAKYAK